MSSNVEKSKKDAEKVEFQDGETILCYHGPLLYEAKCLKTEQIGNKSPQYLIHYSGWNKNWDEWVPRERILKFSEENIRKQKDLQKTQATAAAKATSRSSRSTRKRASTTNASTTNIAVAATGANNSSTSTENDRKSNETLEKVEVNNKQKIKEEEAMGQVKEKKRRTKLDEVKNDDQEYIKKCELSIKIDDDLKQILAEDWHNITIENKLVNLPCECTIECLLNDFLKERVDKQQLDKSVYNEFILGIMDLFESILNTKLLYKFERLQYTDTLRVPKNEGKKLSQIYGYIHLLRFFVKVHECFNYSDFDDLSIKQLQVYMNDLLKYLHEHRHKYLNDVKDYYYNPNLVYIQKSSQ